MANLKGSDNPFPSILIAEATEPAAPAAGHQRLYVDSTSHALMITNSSGTQSAVGGGGAGIAVTGCKAYHSTTQSITGGTTATLAFDSEEFDTATYHDNSTNNSRLTVPGTGLYHVGCSAYNNGSGDEMELWFRKNGSTDQRGGVLFIGGVDGNQGHYSTILSLTAADYIEVRCFVKTTADVGSGSAALASEFWMFRLT